MSVRRSVMTRAFIPGTPVRSDPLEHTEMSLSGSQRTCPDTRSAEPIG